MKIAIIGYSGSGKSTLAMALGGVLKTPVLFLDAVNFLPGWAERDRGEARAQVLEFMQKPAWIIDGNYSAFYYEERMAQADAIIFLNFPRRVCVPGALKRYRKYKNTTRESAADGCNEKFDFEFLMWLLFRGRTREIRARFKSVCARYPQKTRVFTTRAQVNEFLERVKTSGRLFYSEE